MQVRLTTWAAMIVAVAIPVSSSFAAKRPTANVPPTLEIEVLDPGVDPVGNPAVLLQRDGSGQIQVDIPPVILVHRYYYSGDRSFQAQILPGGPSIVVANHPKTGERVYVPVQMMPGAPRVTYTSHSIEYDFGEHAMTVHFHARHPATVKYRSGVPLQRKLGNLVHADHWQEGAERFHEQAEATVEHSKFLACGAIAGAKETTKNVLLPVHNLLRMMPFGQAIFGTDWDQRLSEKAAQHRREVQINHAEKLEWGRQHSIPTVR